MSVELPQSVVAWALSAADGVDVASVRRDPMTGGAVAARIERIDIDVLDGMGRERTLTVVQKWTWPHEVIGLRAAQAIRDRTTAIPHLIAEGVDDQGPWLITPFYAGSGVSADRVPRHVFEALALLHATYADTWGNLSGLPVVDTRWWRSLCLSYALDAVTRQLALSPSSPIRRARSVLETMAEDHRASEVLEALPRSLLHGDVHTGNILVDHGQGVLLDWGSARVGCPMLDLANVAALWSPGFNAYSDAWCRTTGTPPDRSTVELGYRWAAVQIPIQYLAWVVQARPPSEVDAALDRAEAALRELRAC